MNPPFNARDDRPTPDALKRQAHVMDDGLFEPGCAAPRRSCKPRGGLAIIARPQSLAPILAALAGRFGSAEIVPVHAARRRAGDPHRGAGSAGLARRACR